MKKSTRKGFTLMEIVVVIAILGLLIMMAVPAVIKVRAGALRNKVLNNLSVIAAVGRETMLERGVNQIAYADLPNIQDKIKAVQGEDYTVLTLSNAGGTLTVTLSGGEVVEYPYSNR